MDVDVDVDVICFMAWMLPEFFSCYLLLWTYNESDGLNTRPW